MDTAHQWPQETAPPRPVGERKVRPQKDEALNCPRCHSTNTKFCYYNNYSLTQPRYFCKSCRRYWTAGGSLRNVPVGGGSRKNKRSSTISSSKPEFSSQNPNLNLASFSAAPQEYHGVTQFLEVPKIENNNNNNNIQLNLSSYPSSSLSAVELLKSSGIAMRGLNNSNYSAAPVVNPNMMYPSGFSFQEFKPQVVGFAVDELEKRYEGHHANNSQENGAAGGKLFFPSFGALSKQNEPSTNEVDNQNKGHGHGGNPPFYWNGNGW